MKSAIFTASLLASAAVAHRHQHARHHKRQDEVVWVTDVDYVTEIVGLTTTYWVTGSKVTLPPTPTHPHAKPSKSNDAPEFYQPNPEPTTTEAVQPVVVVVSTSSTSTTSAPAQTPVNTPAAETPAAETPAADTPAIDTPTPQPTTLATSTTPVAAPAPASTTAASAPSSGGSSSSGGECSEGSPCSGDITYYDAGLGACGITSTNTEHVVALPHAFMGEQSNGNPYCGRTISITCETTGKTSTATVVDKCMGCDGYSIDLSPAVFDDLASESVGRTTATWFFTD